MLLKPPNYPPPGHRSVGSQLSKSLNLLSPECNSAGCPISGQAGAMGSNVPPD